MSVVTTIPNSKKNSSKFSISVNPAYQVSFQQEASGKRVAATKRRVKFRFGFSDRRAIEDGKTGADCRGEEHEISLVWSLTTGKRVILEDDQEIHFSQGGGRKMEYMFESSWYSPGGHMMKIVAHAYAPLFDKPSGFRQFDLQLDGLSFFDMPQIYELGKNNSMGEEKTAFAGSASLSPATPRPKSVLSGSLLPGSHSDDRIAPPVTPNNADATGHHSIHYRQSSPPHDFLSIEISPSVLQPQPHHHVSMPREPNNISPDSMTSCITSVPLRSSSSQGLPPLIPCFLDQTPTGAPRSNTNLSFQYDGSRSSNSFTSSSSNTQFPPQQGGYYYGAPSSHMSHYHGVSPTTKSNNGSSVPLHPISVAKMTWTPSSAPRNQYQNGGGQLQYYQQQQHQQRLYQEDSVMS